MNEFVWTPEYIAEYRKGRNPVCVTCLKKAESTQMMYEIIWNGTSWLTREAPFSGYLCENDAQERIGELNRGDFPVTVVSTRMIPEKGIVLDGVFVRLSTLGELAEQGPYDSDAGRVLLLDKDEAAVLVAHGLAIRETRGGYHGSPMLERFFEILKIR